MTDREIIEELCAVLEECADELRERIDREHQWREIYPDEKRRFERDMAPVHRAHDVLKKARGEK